MTAITFRVSMPRPSSHLFHVSMGVEGWSEPGLTLVFPTWIPGSYLVRDFERHVEGLAATDSGGRPLAVVKTAKNRWEVDTGTERDLVQVSWRVFAREWTVRTCHLDDLHGFWNGTGLFPFPLGHAGDRVKVIVDPPAGWRVTTALRPEDGAATRFIARDFDELYDSPVEVGPHEVHEVRAADRPIRVAFVGGGNEDRAQLLADIARIVEVQARFWGGLPYDAYTVLFHMPKAGARGGLEHMDSTTLNVGRWDFQPREKYLDVLGLVSHEHFHAWNVKRLRPEAFLGYDYERENPTRLLWVMEGFTAYYDNLLVRRADLCSVAEYLVLLGKDLKALDETPGRSLQSAEASSYDAWIKLYRRDEHTRNSTVSYYLKGSLVALCLDLLLRRDTEGRKSLDDVLRLLYARYALPHGGGLPEDGVQPVVEEVSDRSWQGFFDRYVRGIDELPIDEALAAVGLRLDRGVEPSPRAGLSAGIAEGKGGARLTEVWTGGPADRAGLSAEDEVVAWNGFRVDAAALGARMKEARPGDRVRLAFFRDDRLLDAEVTLGTQAGEYKLLPAETTSEAQKAAFESWTGAAWPARTAT